MQIRSSLRRRTVALLAVTAVAVGGTTMAIAANPTPERFAFVARGDNPIDALAAAPLAGRLNAPVVLTPQSTLTDAARDALLAADPDVVVIAGGTSAISAEVQVSIGSLLPDADVRRAAGTDRYSTAKAIGDLFGDIDPSFLMADGTANRAETADTATTAQSAQTAEQAANSAALGGLAADEYQFSKVIREGALGSVTTPAGGASTQTGAQVLPTMTIDAPADGLLSADLLAVDNLGNADGFVALVDWEGPLVFDGTDTDSILEIYNSMIVLTSTGSGLATLNVPHRVDAGSHTIRVFALGAPGTEVEPFLRSLTAHYSSGVSGQWEEFVAPPMTMSEPASLAEAVGIE